MSKVKVPFSPLMFVLDALQNYASKHYDQEAMDFVDCFQHFQLNENICVVERKELDGLFGFIVPYMIKHGDDEVRNMLDLIRNGLMEVS